MKTKIKRHSRSVLSVILAICILISCMMVGLIATDAANGNGNALGAKADDEALGYSNGGYVKGTWDSWATPDGPEGNKKGHDISGDGYTVALAANTTYEFVFVAKDNNDVFKKNGVTIRSTTTNYDFDKSATENAKLKTTVAGNYTFQFSKWNGDDCMRVNITFPSGTETTTWTAVGAYGTTSSSDAGFFGTAWAPTATANDMTKSGTTWSKTWNNVTLSSSTTVYYKVAKNHGWDTAYPAANASQLLAAGTYNITITYNESGNTVNLTYTSVAKSTLTVGNIAHATVTATCNGTTLAEGQSLNNVVAGTNISVKVTPDTGYKCTAVAPSGTGSNSTWSVTMPSSNTTITATITAVTTKKIYFNNSYTLYGSVYAYVYDKDSSDNHTYEYLGPRPGTTMTKLDNSNIWYIEVPSDVDYVEFISGDGKTTGEMTIPTNYTYPKYTAPYNYNAPTETNGGTWGNYIYGSNNKRTNECTVSNGTTMSASNLFTGITATMYDYYTDHEVDNGWLDIASDEYSKGTDASGWKWDPYTKLNSSLSAYANNTAQPKYGVTYPLYFGNLNDKDGGEALVSSYYNFVRNANNSVDLNPNSTAITGLSGKTLANDTIHYYKSGDTNENGAPMAMFDEDFLSGENTQNKALATILRTSSFPVRKTTEGATTTYEDKIYVKANRWSEAGAKLWAHFWGDNGDTGDKQLTQEGDYYVCDIPAGSNKVELVRMSKDSTSIYQEGKVWAKSGNLNVPTSNTDAARLYTHTGTGNDDWGAFSTGNLDPSYGTTTGGHDYYEYDSTGGKDNAYITNLSSDKKTAKIDYYANDAAWSGGTANNTQGFFPFDYANKGGLAKDLGFGMKLTIPFTLNGTGTSNGVNKDGTDQLFRFSGDDDLWVFVDGKLVLDLGGAHARTEGSINFHDKTVTATNKQAIGSATRNGSFASGFNTNENYVHTMTIYYMERGMFESNLKFGFSFHAIPNQFWIDKKIRTKDIINAGFYQPNGQEGTASNQDDTLTEREGRFISKFEASYQNESFTVTHKYGSTAAGATTLAIDKNYTIDNDTQTHSTGDTGTYPIKHDLGNAFIEQFTKGQYFNLKEDYGDNNKYVYTPAFSVWDQANNNQAITATGDNSSGYTFRFNPTTNVTTGIENTNIKARFENYMDAHTLTLKKELTNADDSQAEFTLKVTFDFENDGNYIAYPLYCDVDGTRKQLSNTGTITINPGQILEIEEIPQNAKIKVEEVMTDTVDGYRYDSISLTQGGSEMDPNSYSSFTKGVTFIMHGSDIVATVKNKKPEYKYTLKYTYPSYGGPVKATGQYTSLYGDQSYTVTGVFTDDEIKTYLTLDGSGNPAFKTDALKKTFVNTKAPYEDNFMQTLSFANATIDDTSTGKGWSNDSYTCEATAVATTNLEVNAYFNLPYAVDSDLVPVASDGKVAMTRPSAKGSKDIECFDWYVTSGKSKKNKTGGDPVFVKAPLIIYNGNTPYYFQYWRVKTQNGYGMKSAEYTRCYDYEFNFAVFTDCIIEPVYDTTWAQETASTPNPHPPANYQDYGRYDAELQITSDTTKGINIAFLENSRNQYNNGDNGTRTVSPEAADVVYSDFLLNFNYVAGLQKLKDLPANTKKAGLVIEAVDYMDYISGTTVFDTNKDYNTDANFTSSESDKKTAIINWLEGRSEQHTGFAKSEFDVHDKLDNKNCIQYYFSLNNRAYSADSVGQLVNTMQNRYKVFRAYAYIGDVDGDNLKNITLSQPVYFTIYDTASNGLPDNANKN